MTKVNSDCFVDTNICEKNIVLDSGEGESGERNSFSKPYCPRRRCRVYLNSLIIEVKWIKTAPSVTAGIENHFSRMDTFSQYLRVHCLD